ncbi:MAG: T9SS type B sorting domain-containing protein [Bacteroidetes bacterium]|nr:MAG: T9SS type B sorting domain-containing protein [Bacteroidota bacterium]
MKTNTKLLKFIQRSILILVGCLLVQSVYAQKKLAWSRIDGEGGHGWNSSSWNGGTQDMVADEYGNLYSAGMIGGGSWGSGTLDFGNNVTATAQQGGWSVPYVVKYNRKGEAQWATTIEIPTGSYLFITSLAADTAGNVYIIGSTYTYNTINSIAGFAVAPLGKSDVWIVKLDAVGIPQWAQLVGGSGDDYPTGITVSAQGEIYCTGLYQTYFQFGTSGISGSSNGWSVFLLKLRSDGTANYARRIATADGQNAWWSAGGDVVVDRTGNVFVSGSFTGVVRMGATTVTAGSSFTEQNGFVMKVLPANGTTIWGRQMGFSASALDVDDLGRIYVAGKSKPGCDTFVNTVLPGATPGYGEDDLYISRLDQNGNLDWVERVGDRSLSFSNCVNPWTCQRINISSLEVDFEGKVLISGAIDRTTDSASVCDIYVPPFSTNSTWWNYNTDAFLLKLTPAGDCDWHARSGVRTDTAITTWTWEKSNSSGVCTDNAGAIFWKTTRAWGWNINNDSLKFYWDNDTIASKAHLIDRGAVPAIWAIRENMIEVDSFSPRYACPGDSITVWYSKYNPFNLGNKFTARISNSTGNFFDALELGTVTDTGSGFIKGIIPLQLDRGAGYKIRVDGSAPGVRGYPSFTNLELKGKPATDAGPDFEICFGDTVVLNPGGGGYNFAWFSDPTLNDTSLYQPMVYPLDSHYYVLRSEDSVTNCYNLDTVDALLVPNPRLLPRTDSTICQGESLWLYARGQHGRSSQYAYQWLAAIDKSVLGYKDSLFVNPRKTTDYLVVLYDSCSIIRDTATIRITVRDHLKANPRSDTLLCNGEPVNVYAKTTGGWPAGYQYAWYIQDTVLLSSDSAWTWLNVDSTAQLKLVVSDGCSDEGDSANFKAFRRGHLNVIPRSDTTICIGESIALRASGLGGNKATYSFVWDQGAGTGDSVIVSPTSTTTYRVILTDNCSNIPDTGFLTINVRQPISVIVRSDSTICQGETIQLYVDGTGGDSAHYSFLWDGIGYGNNITVNPLVTTNYKVTLTDNCTHQVSQDDVTITVRAPLTLTHTPDTLLCREAGANLHAWGSGGNQAGYQFTWSDGGPIDQVSGPNTPFYINPNVNTTVKVKLTDNCTIGADSALIRVTLRAPLAAKINVVDTLICHGAELNLSVTPSGGLVGSYLFEWVGKGFGPNLAFNPKLDEALLLITKDGCSPDDSTFVNVRVRPALKVIATQDTLICPEVPTMLTSSGSGGTGKNYRYTWLPANTAGSNLLVRPANPTSYIIKLEDLCSEPAYDTVNLTMAPMPTTSFNTNTVEGCQPLEVDFDALYTTSGGNWLWKFGDGRTTNGNQAMVTHTYVDHGTHSSKLFVTSDYGCVDSSYEIDILVHPKPIAQFTTDPLKTDITNPVVKFINQSQFAVSYKWDFGDGQGISEQISPTYTYSDTGLYPVRLEVYSDQNCSDVLVKDYRINEIYSCFIPNSFTPNGDNRNDVFGVTGTGIEQMHFAIYDRWGALVYESNQLDAGWNGRWNNTGELLPIGTYVYKVNLLLYEGGRKNLEGTVLLYR